MSNKTSHLGMAGHYAAMAEFLRRGYNVAIPAVDIGDDIIVIEDSEGRLRRVQVKTAEGSDGKVKFNQIDLAVSGSLFFMLTTWLGDQWIYLFETQDALLAARRKAMQVPRVGGGRPMISSLTGLTIEARVETSEGGTALRFWGDSWPMSRWLDDHFPPLQDGPGARA